MRAGFPPATLRSVKRSIVLAVLLAVLDAAAPAVAAGSRAAALRRALGPDARVMQHRDTGLVRFVGSRAGRPLARPAGVAASAPPAAAARAFFAMHGEAFGIRDQARELRDAGAACVFETLPELLDRLADTPLG